MLTSSLASFDLFKSFEGLSSLQRTIVNSSSPRHQSAAVLQVSRSTTAFSNAL
jgi:hypothetical protein